MSATRIARLEEVLWRGLDMGKQNADHDERWLELLAEFEALTDQERGTCRRTDRVGLRLDGEELAAAQIAARVALPDELPLRPPGAALTQGALAINAGRWG